MTVAAFHLGLMNRVEDLALLFENERVLYHHGYTAGELRKMLIRRELPRFIERYKLYALAKQVVDLAYDGLSCRRLGEESLLEPLYQRIETQTNPAEKMLRMKDSGVDIQDIVIDYAKI